VRRYIVMLQDMGIPVEAERGPYGAYQLRRGYKLPPLMFTDAEAVALTLGLLAIREFHFPVDLAAVEGALAKTERVMPEKLLNQIRALQEAITFNFLAPTTPLQNDFVTPLSLAARQRRQVFLRYQSWNGEVSARNFDPYGIVFNQGYWYTAGYCHLRQDLRTFRLDRIVALEPCEETFTRPEDFDTLAHVLDSLVAMPGTEQLVVLLKTSPEQAQQAVSPEMGTLEETANGVLFRRSATQLPWIAHFLLTLDFPVQVIQTDELKRMLREMAAKAAQIAGEEKQHGLD
jgi:predicted DNA-binding transcriptional regulator YafY